MTDTVTNEIKSPCVGLCSIDLDTNYCQGCFRTEEEISVWREATTEEKQEILNTIEERKEELFS